MGQHFYRLRWRFTFFDHKPDRCGMWSAYDDKDANGAWAVNKTNLARAMIEYEDIATYKTGVFADCDGPDFVNLEWIATASSSPAEGFEVLKPVIQGLALVTKDLRLQVFTNGDHRVLARDEAEKKIHLVGFGR